MKALNRHSGSASCWQWTIIRTQPFARTPGAPRSVRFIFNCSSALEMRIVLRGLLQTGAHGGGRRAHGGGRIVPDDVLWIDLNVIFLMRIFLGVFTHFPGRVHEEFPTTRFFPGPRRPTRRPSPTATVCNCFPRQAWVPAAGPQQAFASCQVLLTSVVLRPSEGSPFQSVEESLAMHKSWVAECVLCCRSVAVGV